MRRTRERNNSNKPIHEKLRSLSIEHVFLLLPLYASITGAVAVLWLLLDNFSLITVVPTSIILSAIATKIVLESRLKESDSKATSREINSIGVLTLIGIIIWVGVNALYTAQNVFVYRDPAIYTVTGRMLVDDNSLQIFIPEYLRGMPDVEHQSAGFGRDTHSDDKLFAQGLHFLPTLLGLSGRVAGEAVMLRTAPILGGLALIAFYGFIRRFTKPRWAALGVLVLGLSLPMIYFSRDTYTEPLSIMLIFNALAFFTLALRSERVGLWGVSGLLLGAISLVRADGLIVLASAVACLVVYLSLAPKEKRSALTKKSLLLLSVSGLLVGLSVLDMRILSSGYYSIHGKEVKQLLLIIALLLVAGSLLIILSWRTNILKKTEGLFVRWRLPVAFCLLGSTILFLALRPFWQISRDSGQAEVITSYVAGLQALNGDTIDPTRNYAEQTGNWLVWYLGFGIVIAAIFGLFIATRRLVVKKEYTLLLPLTLIVGASMIFIVKVGITPDQIWAARRFLPITFPGIIFFGVLALEKSAGINRKIKGIRLGPILTILLILIIGFEVGRVTYPLAQVRVYGGQLRQVRAVCQEAKGERLAVWLGPDAWNGVQSIKSYCGIDAVSLREVSDEKLQSVESYARSHSLRPVFITTGYDYANSIGMVGEELDFREVSRVDFTTVPSVLHGPPAESVVNSRSILIAK